MHTQLNNAAHAAAHNTRDTLKDAILEALDRFIRQRPGVEAGNFVSPYDRGEARLAGIRAYRAELRDIGRDLNHARTLLRRIELAPGITGNDLIHAARAYSGRLTIQPIETPDGYKVRLHYTTGQYFPTEYRRAVCAVASSALWDHVREHCMPPPVYFVEYANERGGYSRADNRIFATYDEAQAHAVQVEQDRKVEAQRAFPADAIPRGYGRAFIQTEYRGMSAGDYLRKHFRREFGRAIASRFFN